MQFAAISGTFGADIEALAFSPDGTWLAAGTVGSIFVWDVASGEQVALISIPTALAYTVRQIIIAEGGRYLAWIHSGQGNALLFLYDRETEQFTDLGYEEAIQQIALLPGRMQIAVAGATLDILDLRTGTPVQTLPIPDFTYARQVQASADGSLLAAGVAHYAGAFAGLVMLWETATWTQGATIQTDATTTEESGTYGLPLQALGIDEGQVVTVDGAGLLQNWEVDGAQLTMGTSVPDTYALQISPADERLALLFHDDARDIAAGDVLRELALPPSRYAVQGAAFSPDGRLLAVAAAGNRVQLWEINPTE
jgi:WD40 repeat protein